MSVSYGESLPTYTSLYVIEMSQLRRDDAGNTGSTFYQVTLQPGNWYKWFRTPMDKRSSDHDEEAGYSDNEPEGTDEEPKHDEKEETDDDSGWTEVYYIFYYAHFQSIL